MFTRSVAMDFPDVATNASKWYWVWPDGKQIEPLGAHPGAYIAHLRSTGWAVVGETNLDRDPFPEIIHFTKQTK